MSCSRKFSSFGVWNGYAWVSAARMGAAGTIVRYRAVTPCRVALWARRASTWRTQAIVGAGEAEPDRPGMPERWSDAPRTTGASVASGTGVATQAPRVRRGCQTGALLDDPWEAGRREGHRRAGRYRDRRGPARPPRYQRRCRRWSHLERALQAREWAGAELAGGQAGPRMPWTVQWPYRDRYPPPRWAPRRVVAPHRHPPTGRPRRGGVVSLRPGWLLPRPAQSVRSRRPLAGPTSLAP